MKTLVVIPAYNEQDNIMKTLSDLREHCPEMDVLVINDCSGDRTLEILEEAGVQYLNLANNLGIGGAVQAGYIYARENDYDIAIQFDGNGQHRAEYLHKLAEPVESGEADVAIVPALLAGMDCQEAGKSLFRSERQQRNYHGTKVIRSAD